MSEQDYEIFENMKKENPRRYAIEGEGEWGISEGAIYTRHSVENFSIEGLMEEMLNSNKNLTPVFGIDFGFSADPTAFIFAIADEKNYKVYVCDEWYAYGATNLEIVGAIREKGFHNQNIYADSADPRTINELRLLGLGGIRGVKKGRDSVLAGIKKLQDYDIIIHPNCENIQYEIANYVWDKDRQTDRIIEKPIDEYNHALDALRYACQDIGGKNFVW